MAESERMRGNRPPVAKYKVGDGSVGDLFRYIVGEDLPVKKMNGKKKTTTIKNKTEKEIVRSDISRNFNEVSSMSAVGSAKRFEPIIPPYVEVRDIPSDMEFYQTGMPDKEMGLRGTTGIPPRSNRFVVSAPEAKRTVPLVDPVYGSVVSEEDTQVDSETRLQTLLDSILNEVGPDTISAAENAEIDRVAYYLENYPEILEAAKKLKVQPTQEDIIAIIEEYEKSGKIKPRPRKAYGGRVKTKMKRKTYSKSYNY